MAYANLKFCWHGCVSTDVERAKAFYTEVVGWNIVTTPMGDDEATMFAAAGVPRAHLMAPPMEGVPSHWTNYLRVEDVDASTAAAVEHGGQVMVPPTDIPVGRFSVVTSPSGAAVSLFHEGDPSAENAPREGNGHFHWTELHSTDIAADLPWLQATFGLTISEMPMPQGGTYNLLMHGDELIGGAMPNMHEGAPSMWLTWVAVDDVDAAYARVSANGGTQLGELWDMPGTGRMGIVQDPTGAVIGLIQPEA